MTKDDYTLNIDQHIIWGDLVLVMVTRFLLLFLWLLCGHTQACVYIHFLLMHPCTLMTFASIVCYNPNLLKASFFLLKFVLLVFGWSLLQPNRCQDRFIYDNFRWH